MRGKINQLKSDDDRYGYSSPIDIEDKRLNVKDLLKRATDEKIKRKKVNLVIFSGTAFLILMFFFLLSF